MPTDSAATRNCRHRRCRVHRVAELLATGGMVLMTTRWPIPCQQPGPLPAGARVRLVIEGTVVDDDKDLFVGFWQDRAVQLFNRRVVDAEVLRDA